MDSSGEAAKNKCSVDAVNTLQVGNASSPQMISFTHILGKLPNVFRCLTLWVVYLMKFIAECTGIQRNQGAESSVFLLNFVNPMKLTRGTFSEKCNEFRTISAFSNDIHWIYYPVLRELDDVKARRKFIVLLSTAAS